jgi:RNA-directed DNA polymerase
MNAYKANNILNEKAQQLCEKLYLAAKKSKTRRFHQLYDKLYRVDILKDSWEIVKQNKGCAGADGVGISDVILQGQDKYLQELHETLLDTHKYLPQKIKRVYIPKADGKQRPLGIPAIRDRIVQTATKTLLEPIFEADFLDCSYGFRPTGLLMKRLKK